MPNLLFLSMEKSDMQKRRVEKEDGVLNNLFSNVFSIIISMGSDTLKQYFRIFNDWNITKIINK